jgi:hypothetical protein
LLVLFACHNPKAEFTPHQIGYIKKLIGLQHTKIVVLSTHSRIKRVEDWPQTVEIVNDKNEDLDFGLWWRYLEKNKSQLEKDEYESILLVNDSCEATLSFNDLWERMSKHEFWGITDSYEYAHHIQSYWLSFNSKTAIKNLWNFIDICESIKGATKPEIIKRREIAISIHMVEKGHSIVVAYPFHIFNNPKKYSNISYFFHYELKALGCPLLKNNRNRQKRVIQAKFGTIERNMDVSQIVTAKWENYQGVVVKPEVLGCDPAFKVKKIITILWLDDAGIEHATTLDENSTAAPWV